MRNDATKERIASLDVLRGAAVLGILLMNIQSFSMISSAYFNPLSYGDFSGPNAAVWAFTRLFADQKFMTLFSMLFGAGIVLMNERTAAMGGRSWAAHYRRMIVLLVVGLAHGILLWYGDVLTIYAICGMVLYWVRKWSGSILFVLGIAAILASAGILWNAQSTLGGLTDERLEEWEQVWSPDDETVASELDLYRGAYWDQVQARMKESNEVYDYFIMTWFGRIAGLMLVGMAIMKWNILSALGSPNFYWRLLKFGLIVGIAVEGLGIFYQARSDWAINAMMPGLLFNYFASLFIACGYLAAVMLLHQSGQWPKVQNKLAAVGRMAFTNYLAQTLICTTIFYGYGLGWFGYVERWQQVIFVVAIWLLQIAWSEAWLARFQSGPLEWLWRCATYFRIVPLRKGRGFTPSP